MIAVDSTVLADVLFADEMRQASVTALKDYDPEWAGLGLVSYEVGNVAWKMVNFAGMDAEIARSALAGMESLLSNVERNLDMPEVFDVAVEFGLTFYDAAHVWFAKRNGLLLFTRDKKVLANCPQIARPMPG